MSEYIAGLDLGQRQDPTALVVLECDRSGVAAQYQVRHVERAPLGTSYSAIAGWLGERLTRAPVRGHVQLVADETGVGAAVIEILERARLGCSITPVTITAGMAVSEEHGRWRVAKSVLISHVDAALDGDRLQIAASLPAAGALVGELHAFQRKYTAAANEVFGSWREGQHDDLVLALALAVWYGEAVGDGWHFY